MSTIQPEHFTKALLMLLDETFEHVNGFYLDGNTSLFETLSDITAEEASIAVGGRCATLAAQVKHTAFYLDVLEKSIRDPNIQPADWGEIWRTVNVVTPPEWGAIQGELSANYERIVSLIESTPDWTSENEIGRMIAIVAHTAYHLGEIRQALCTIRQ